MVVTPEGVSDDILAFVSLARLASGDASMADVLSLASGLMRDLAPAVDDRLVRDRRGEADISRCAMRHGPAARPVEGNSLRLGEGVSGWVAANRQVMINSEASLDLGEQAHSGVPLKHALSVPLITRESLVGTITLYAETTFTESQSRLVQVIAPHLAQAIWAAKRHDARMLARTGRAHGRCGKFRSAARLDAMRHSRSASPSPAHIPVDFASSTFLDLPQISS